MRSCVLIGFAAAAMAAACGAPAPASRPAPRPNVVLITIDTLRADRLGRGLTPALDALASTGRQFGNARSAVPLTLPSHVTIMTGALPPVHGVRDNGVRFDGSVPTLARSLESAGYRTAAFVGAYVLDRRFGLADGFDTYDDRVHRDPNLAARLEAERKGGEVADAALAWLASATDPFFLWVHFYDPHAPYDPPAEYRSRAGGNAYDGEVAYADAQVGRVLDALRARGLLDRTIVVAAGDHGESLGDHGEQTHGMLTYDSALRVPLIVSGPAVQPARISSPVSLADIAPSLLRRTGVQAPGQSGASDLFGDSRAARDVYAETEYPRAAGWHPLAALAGERWKLILSSETELYDLASDPGETKNVAADHAAIVQGMTAAIEPMRRVAARGSAGAVPAEAAERLRALGYVSGSAGGAVESRAPNPAGVIAGWTEFERALSLVNAARAREALPSLQKLAEAPPGGLVFTSTYARALMEAGQPARAVALYRDAVKQWPADAALFHDLAVAARAAGNVAEATRAEQAALALDAKSPEALNGLGLLQADGGRAADAAASFEAAAAGDPTNASYWTNLGNARRALGDLAAAERAYKRALEADATYPDAANGLGVLLVQQKRAADAVPWFERALQHAPDFHEAQLNLGIAWQESGQRDKAAAAYRVVLASAPPRSREHRAAADLLAQLR